MNLDKGSKYFWPAAVAGLWLGLGWTAPPGAEAQQRVGPERCAECHKLEFKAWNESTHAQLLSDSDDDAVLDKADEISSKLAIDDIESDDSCVGCHFSYFDDEEGEQQITSIDCESCHGAAVGWVEIHGDYGSKDGKQIKEASEEDPAHAKDRIARSKAAGWLHPGEIVLVTGNCLGCHTGPGEKVVNVGGHPPGSEFELVSWLNGEVRHNYHRTNQTKNAPISPERARQLYVVGRALDLEYALRGLATATKPGPYLDAMSQRVEAARRNLEAVAAKAKLPEVGRMLEASAGVPLEQNQKAKAEAAAQGVHEAALAFAASHDGSGLASLDPLIPTDAKGSAYTER